MLNIFWVLSVLSMGLSAENASASMCAVWFSINADFETKERRLENETRRLQQSIRSAGMTVRILRRDPHQSPHTRVVELYFERTGYGYAPIQMVGATDHVRPETDTVIAGVVPEFLPHLRKETSIDAHFLLPSPHSVTNLEANSPSPFPGITIDPRSTEAERRSLLKHFPLSELVAKAGHNVVRRPESIESRRESIRESIRSGKPLFSEDSPIMINIVTAFDGSITDVDAVEGHHSLPSILLENIREVGELHPRDVVILVNGAPPSDMKRDRIGNYVLQDGVFLNRVHVSGIPLNMFQDFTFQATETSKPGTVLARSDLSNRPMGSRLTVGKLADNIAKLQERNKSRYLAIFLNAHYSRLQAVQMVSILSQSDFDRIVIIPEKADARALNQWIGAIESIEGSNSPRSKLDLYLGNIDAELDRFGKSLLLDRMAKHYGVSKITALENIAELETPDLIESEDLPHTEGFRSFDLDQLPIGM